MVDGWAFTQASDRNEAARIAHDDVCRVLVWDPHDDAWAAAGSANPIPSVAPAVASFLVSVCLWGLAMVILPDESRFTQGRPVAPFVSIGIPTWPASDPDVSASRLQQLADPRASGGCAPVWGQR